jgi:hypothetical protein
LTGNLEHFPERLKSRTFGHQVDEMLKLPIAFLRNLARSYASRMSERMRVRWQLLVATLFIVAPALSQPNLPSRTVPKLHEAVVPHYPPIAVAAHITGQVVVNVTVKSGRVVGTDVKADEAHPNPAAIRFLNPPTIQNIQSWQFAEDVNDSFTVTFTYKIDGAPSPEPSNPTVEMLPSLDVKITARPWKPTICMDGPCPKG